ncbi:unnamed protein product [Peronospora belbahrii]|uniref:Plasma membrane fusion protein PRM1 n=1 Tax=Peronospora belbahrii TaxID=622444 RepID=A0AAU9KS54_9STRA|nr:unnamed protein product [Peronospora belbahrii]
MFTSAGANESDEMTLEDKTVEYACLQSPSTPPEDPKRKTMRWFHNYPRFCFVVLFMICTFIGGIFVSSEITTWTLDAMGVHNDLTTARQVYATTSHMLNTMTQCVNRSSLEYLAGAKLHFEADSKRVQRIIDANDQVLANQRNTTMTCSNSLLMALKEQVQMSTANAANSTLKCFTDSFYANMPKTEDVSSSRSLVLAVRALLITQVATEVNNSVSKQATKFESQLVEMWTAIDTVKSTIEKTVGATRTLVSQQLSSLAPVLSGNDGRGHTQQSASRLGRLGKVVSSKLSNPLTLTSAASLGAIRKTGRTLHKALEFLAGVHDGFTDVLDTVDETWELLEKQLNATVQQATQLQQELVYTAESTAQQINNATSAITISLDQAQQEIATSFDILREQWQAAVKKLIAEGFTPWERLGDQLVAELTANQHQSVRPKNAIQRKYLLPDRSMNSSLKNEHQKLTVASRDEGLNSTQASTSDEEKFDIDTAVLRASLVDVSALITQVIFYVDIGRLAVLVADLAVGLITESYSDMPMLDIRGITTVDTIGSVCEVFLCQHSISAICYTLVTKATELLRVVVTFLLLFFAASAITIGLFVWKNDHNAHCQSSDVSTNVSQTTMQRITRAFFENNGNKSERVVSPLDEVQKYATTINDSIRNDYAALTVDSAIVWKNQSIALDDFDDWTATTSSLIRMLQDCTINDEVARAVDTSLSSQCLVTSLSNTSAFLTPLSITEQLSHNAPFLVPSTAFELCFPAEALHPVERHVIVDTLQHHLACATEKAVYFSAASWWLLVVVFVANRFAARMIIKAAGVYWWRYLSANRLQFVGFCQEDGDVVASNKLQPAIQQYLKEAKWQIVCRFVGIGFAFLSVVTVIVIAFHGVA